MDEYLGTIKYFAFNFAPYGWGLCDGQLMSIAANTALFSLLGTTYGGDGQQTFALPDLRGRTIVHPGYGPGLEPVLWGEVYGTNQTTILTSNMPTHAHMLVNGEPNAGVKIVTQTKISTAGGANVNESGMGEAPLATGGGTPSIYSEGAPGADFVGGISSQNYISGMTSVVGATIPIDISDPFLTVTACIAVEGVYPSRQ